MTKERWKNNGGKKSTHIEVEKRIRIIQEWILEGYATTDIITQLTITYQITQRQAYNYIKKAFDSFKEKNQHTIDQKKGYHIALRQKMLKELQEKKTPEGTRTALRIADSMARIEGLMVVGNAQQTNTEQKPTKIEITIVNEADKNHKNI